jgi:heme/copper-type cytochrome/quinol oxidase subunit 2
VLALACGLLVAGTVHVAKAGVMRPLVTATTGGTANTPVSIAEDVTSTLLSIIAVVLPIIIGTLIVVLAAFIFYWLYRRSDKQTT